MGRKTNSSCLFVIPEWVWGSRGRFWANVYSNTDPRMTPTSRPESLWCRLRATDKILAPKTFRAGGLGHPWRLVFHCLNDFGRAAVAAPADYFAPTCRRVATEAIAVGVAVHLGPGALSTLANMVGYLLRCRTRSHRLIKSGLFGIAGSFELKQKSGPAWPRRTPALSNDEWNFMSVGPWKETMDGSNECWSEINVCVSSQILTACAATMVPPPAPPLRRRTAV